MPRRSTLSAAERETLLALPEAKDELIRLYTLSETDLAIIRQHHGGANRLGFAVQLCYMRHPGVMLEPNAEPFAPLLCMVAAQLKMQAGSWAEYGQRAETRRERDWIAGTGIYLRCGRTPEDEHAAEHACYLLRLRRGRTAGGKAGGEQQYGVCVRRCRATGGRVCEYS